MGTIHVSGPSQAGPGERSEMLDVARAFLTKQGVEPSDVVRVDVPGRGAGEEGTGTNLRAELEPAVPVLQSGSLFGGQQGLLIVDAQNLQAAEAQVLAELVETMDQEAVILAVVAAGSMPATLTKALKSSGQVAGVRKMWENNAAKWLDAEIKRRKMDMPSSAADALIQRFGTDVASLGQALDQLADSPGKITAAAVLDRFRNRPNEPIFHYTDAIVKGDTGEALRRLGDLLVHVHPLQILGALEGEVKRRSMALVATDIDSLRQMAGARASDRWVERVWRDRGRMRDSGLRRATEALVRADRTLKSAPEEIHRVTMERLTVAMCRWMVGR